MIVSMEFFHLLTNKRQKKNSKNRAAGTWETKAHQHVTKEFIRDMLLYKVIPAIVQNWPPQKSKNITIQWDNARPHQIPTDDEFQAALTQNGFNIKLVYQPTQSPDLNVLDLGLFRAIQSLQYHSFPKNIDELIERVEEAYEFFDPMVNKYTWITLQSCMVEILKKEGGNNYKIPHMKKQRLENLGSLPDILYVSQELVEQGVKFLNDRFKPARNEGQGDEDNHLEVDAD